MRTRRGYDELESFPNKVEIFTASVDGDLRDPAYIMKCARTPTPTHTPAALALGLALLLRAPAR